MISGRSIFIKAAHSDRRQSGGADIIYVGASVDKSSLILLGQQVSRPLSNSAADDLKQPRPAHSAKLSCA